jgi:hypothetical protein
MVTISEIGLISILVGWVVQFFSGESKQLSITFIFFYLFGILLLVVDGIINGLRNSTILNLACFILGIAVLIKIARTRRKH